LSLVTVSDVKGVGVEIRTGEGTVRYRV